MVCYIEVFHKDIKNDNLKNIMMIAREFLKEKTYVSYGRVKHMFNNDICVMVCKTDQPLPVIKSFLMQYFPMWEWRVSP